MSDIQATRGMVKLLRHMLHQRNDDNPVTFTSANAQTGMGREAFYSSLSRLETEGWVEAEMEKVPEGSNRPSRRFYRLTVTGAARALSLVESYPAQPPFRDWLMRVHAR